MDASYLLQWIFIMQSSFQFLGGMELNQGQALTMLKLYTPYWSV